MLPMFKRKRRLDKNNYCCKRLVLRANFRTEAKKLIGCTFKATQLRVLIFCQFFTCTLRGQTVHFVRCKRIPQPGRSLCFYFVLYFPLIVPTKFLHFKRLFSGIQEHTDTKLCSYPVHSLAS